MNGRTDPLVGASKRNKGFFVFVFRNSHAVAKCICARRRSAKRVFRVETVDQSSTSSINATVQSKIPNSNAPSLCRRSPNSPVDSTEPVPNAIFATSKQMEQMGRNLKRSSVWIYQKLFTVFDLFFRKQALKPGCLKSVPYFKCQPKCKLSLLGE